MKVYIINNTDFNAHIKLKDFTILSHFVCIFLIYLLVNYSSSIHLLMLYVNEDLVFKYYEHCEECFQIVSELIIVNSNFLLAFRDFLCLFRNVKHFLMIMVLLVISLAVILR